MRNFVQIISSAAAFGLILHLPAFSAPRPVSPWLFGQNLWMDINSEPPRPGYVYRLWNQVGASGVRIVRIGGANYDGKYPSDEAYLAWIDSVRRIGAEPLVQVSRRVADRAARAARLVRFLNVEKGLGVRFWSIGNEPGLRETISAAQIAAYTREISFAMRDVDPDIRIFMGEMAWFSEPYCAAWLGGAQDLSGKDSKGRWWIDGVTYHTYPHSKAYTRDDVVLKDGANLRSQFSRLSALVEAANLRQGRTGAAALGWGLTEFNVTYDHPEDHSASGIGVPSFLNGQLWAEVFGLGMEFGAHSIIPWCIHESDPGRPETDFGFIGPYPEFNPRPTYHHFQMMSRSMPGGFVASACGMKRVKAVATRNAEGTSVMILNQAQAAYPGFRVSLDGRTPAGDSLHCAVAGEAGGVHRLDLKGETTYLLHFDAVGRLIRKATYGLERALEDLPPGWDTTPTGLRPAYAPRRKSGSGPAFVGKAVFPHPGRGARTYDGAGKRIE